LLGCQLPGNVCGDPRFNGGDGNTFYFHGRKNQDFCIVSDSNLHINAHFIGNHNPSIKRDFTWIQSLGILFDNHKIYLGAEKTVVWSDDVDHLNITFDGQAISLPLEKSARWVSAIAPGLSVSRNKAFNGIIVELEGNFKIMANAVPITEEDSRIHNYGVDKNDSLAHLDLGFKFYSLTDHVQGVLGQTYRPDYVNKMDVRKNMPVMGGAPKYVSSHIFATDCEVSQFSRDNGATATF
jgi:Root cap